MGVFASIRGWFEGRRQVDQAVAYVEAQGKGATDAAPRTKALGGSGTPIYSGVIQDLDPNIDLRGPGWYGEPGCLGVAQKMLRDGHVRRCMRYITAPLLAGIWDFKPDDPKRPADVECAKFNRRYFIDEQNFHGMLSWGLHAYAYGTSFSEMTDAVAPIDRERFPLHPGGGYGIVPTGFHQRPLWTIKRFNQSEEYPERLESVVQWLSGSDGEKAGYTQPLPADRLIRWTLDQEGANFAGFPLMRGAYGPWRLKVAFLKILAMKLERQALGIPRITLPEEPSEDDLAAAMKILAGIRAHSQGYMALPFGYEFKWEQATATDDELAYALELCNRDISYAFGTGFMELGLSTKSGSNALAQSQAGHYEIDLNGIAKWFAYSINQGCDGWSPVARISRLNYGASIGVPKLYCRNLPTRDWSKLLPVVWNGVICGGITMDDPFEDWIREGIEAPERDPLTARKYTGPAAKLNEDNSAPPKKAGSEPANGGSN